MATFAAFRCQGHRPSELWAATRHWIDSSSRSTSSIHQRTARQPPADAEVNSSAAVVILALALAMPVNNKLSLLTFQRKHATVRTKLFSKFNIYKWRVTIDGRQETCYCYLLYCVVTVHRRVTSSCRSEALRSEQLFHPSWEPSGSGASENGSAVKASQPTNKIPTYLQRILQKHPKLLPLGTSPAYDIVMFGTA